MRNTRWTFSGPGTIDTLSNESVVGVLVFGNVFDRLHYAGAGTTLGPLLIGAAVLVRQTTSAAGITTTVIMVLVLVLGPALLIATARAARKLEFGRIGATDRERGSG